MMGLRFALVMELGVGAPSLHGRRLRRRSIDAERAVTERTKPRDLSMPGSLGRGPLEPEDSDWRPGEERFGRGMRR